MLTLQLWTPKYPADTQTLLAAPVVTRAYIKKRGCGWQLAIQTILDIINLTLLDITIQAHSNNYSLHSHS